MSLSERFGVANRENKESFNIANGENETWSDVANEENKKWLDVAIEQRYIKSIDFDSLDQFDLIAKGSFGKVEVAYLKSIRKKVVLKSLIKVNKQDQNFYKVFVNELKNISVVDHSDNVIRFLGVSNNTRTNSYFLVFQFADEGNLHDYLRELHEDGRFSELDWPRKIEMAKDIASGLFCIHAAGIIHRDLHSKNVMIHNRRLMITDFGLSRSRDIGTIVTGYTPIHYCDPRYLKNHLQYKRSKPSDIYSLGILFWEISSGRGPKIEYVDIVNGKRETPVDGTPIDYMNIYTRAWDDDPDKRPTIEPILDKLELILKNRENIKLLPTHQAKATSKILARNDSYLSEDGSINSNSAGMFSRNSAEMFSRNSAEMFSRNSAGTLSSSSTQMFGRNFTNTFSNSSTRTFSSIDLFDYTEENDSISRGSSQDIPTSFENSYENEASTEYDEQEETFALNNLTLKFTLQELRYDIQSCFTSGNYVKALELWETILKDPRHTPEDQQNAVKWNLRENKYLLENQQGELAGITLSRVLSKNAILKSLDLENNKLRVSAGKALANALHGNTTLTDLNLSKNKIGSSGAKVLAKALRKNTTLRNLNLADNAIGDVAGKSLAEALGKNNALVDLNLSENQMADSTVQALAETLKRNTTLKKLNLSINGLNDSAVKALAEALRVNNTLTNLDISESKLGNPAVKALAEALCVNTTLTNLNLRYSQLSGSAIKELAKALCENTSLTVLNLCWNEIGEQAAKALAETLRVNTSLTNLYVDGSQLGDKAGTILVRALSGNFALTNLDLGHNQLGELTGKALAQVLRENTVLTHINLGYNKLNDLTGEALARALHKNTVLTELNLHKNQLGDQAGSALVEALRQNTTIRCLNLRDNMLTDEFKLNFKDIKGLVC